MPRIMAPTSTTSATGAGLASRGFGVGPTCSRIWRPCLGRTWSASRRRRSPQHVSWVGSSRPRGDAPIRILLRRPLRAEPPRTHRPKRLAQPSPAPPGRARLHAWGCVGKRSDFQTVFQVSCRPSGASHGFAAHITAPSGHCSLRMTGGCQFLLKFHAVSALSIYRGSHVSFLFPVRFGQRLAAAPDAPRIPCMTWIRARRRTPPPWGRPSRPPVDSTPPHAMPGPGRPRGFSARACLMPA